MKVGILSLDPATYQSHAIHGEDRLWIETNCYVDMWVELLHAFDFDPVAPLGFTLAIDFEGDQWTFFKYPLADLYQLYGLDVQELNIWLSLADHVEEQVALGRPVTVEVDSFHLPDTAGTTYRTEHGKTTIAVQEIDIEDRQLGYFHAQGYYSLVGEDFENIFRLGSSANDPAILAPYTEYVKMEGAIRPSGEELVEGALALARMHLLRRPAENPIERFRPRLERDVEWLKQQSLEMFHYYSFATLRQCGACFELLETFTRWLSAGGIDGLELAADDFRQIASGAKILQFKLARVAGRQRDLDVHPILDDMAASWEAGMDELATAISAA